MFKVSSQSFSNVDKMSNLFYFKRCRLIKNVKSIE